jgi:hypothetical protein
MFKKRIKSEVSKLFNDSMTVKAGIITEDDIRGLPEPVRRHLHYAQVIGKEVISTVRLKQKGYIRMKAEQRWMPLEAEQYYTTNPPAFLWYGTASPFPFLSVKAMKARDMFSGGKGAMLVKLFGLVNVVNASGPEMDQASLLRYLNEIMWFPSAYLSEFIEWDTLDSRSVKATMTYSGVIVSAVLHFNEDGRLMNFVSGRYRYIDGQNMLCKWSTPVQGQREVNGIRIPDKGEAIWHMDSGEFSYIQLEITDIEYNNPSVY